MRAPRPRHAAKATEGPIPTQPWKYAGKHRLARRYPDDVSPTSSGARLRTVALIIGFAAAALAIVGFITILLIFGQPTQRGHTRSLPHTTTN